MDKKIPAQIHHKALLKFRAGKDLLVVSATLLACIAVNAVAGLFNGTWFFFLFYQGLMVLGICVFFPLWYVGIKNKQPLSDIGITTKGWKKALLVGLAFALLTAPRIIGKGLVLPGMDVLFYTGIALVMSSLFEEIFFRGFLQTRFEEYFGMVPAVLLSGLAFSLYHLGYSDSRRIASLTILFLVGIVLSVAFRITNNVMTSFVANLPQAIVTFIEKRVFFDGRAAAVSFLTIVVAVGLVAWVMKTTEGKHDL